MPRCRSLRPQLREHLAFAALTDGAARLFLSIVTLADDAGRCPAAPAFLSGAVFFARPKPPHVIGQLLAELERSGLIHRYVGAGTPHLTIVGWADNTHPNYQYIKNPQPARYPAPESVGDSAATPPRLRDGGTDIDRNRKGEGRAPPPPAEPSRPEPALAERQELRRAAWAELEFQRQTIASEIGVEARPLPAFDPGLAELAARILEGGDRAAADVRHVLKVYVAEARAKRTVEWLTGSMFRADKWGRALGMTLDDATRSRIGPRPSEPQRLVLAPPDDDMPDLGNSPWAPLPRKGTGS